MSESFPTASAFFQGFEYQRRLNNGSIGDVDLYVHVSTGKQMALKVVRKDRADERYMKRAIKALKNLRHPNMLTYYGHLTTEKEYYLLFEYLPGLDLFSHAKQQEGMRASRRRVAKWMRQVTMALEYLHANRTIHRDVKPSNVLLTSLDWDEADAKLADFDTVRDVEGVMSVSVGTIPYLAPESQSSKYDAKVDVWSLGCMTYQLLTGKLPFQSKAIDELKRGPSYPSDLDPAAKEFIQKCLIFEPEDRFSCEQLLSTQFLSAAPTGSIIRPYIRPPFLSGSMPTNVLEELLVESFHSVLRVGLEQARISALLSPSCGEACAENVLRQANLDLELFEYYAQQNPRFQETFLRLAEKTRVLQEFAEQCRRRI